MHVVARRLAGIRSTNVRVSPLDNNLAVPKVLLWLWPTRFPPSVQDYAKAVYALEAREGAAVSTTELAKRLGVTPGSVSAMVRKLSEEGLVDTSPTTA